MSLVLPDAEAMTPAMVAGYCAEVEAFAAELTNPADVAEVRDRWAAVTEYMRRKSREGIAQAEATMRRLEIRIGQLSPAQQGQRSDLTTSPDAGRSSDSVIPLSPNRMTEARKQAEHPDVVEQVIADSTDDNPPTKAKVLDAIRAAKQAEPQVSPRYTRQQILERWPTVTGPDGVLTDAEIDTLIGDLIDQLATEPEARHDERAHAASTWWRTKTSPLRRAATAFVELAAERPGLATAIAGDPALDSPTRQALEAAREAATVFLKEMSDA